MSGAADIYNRHSLSIALRALFKNRLQTGLALLGVIVGVGALVTSIALGRGAQESVEDQLRAAGANLIVVTAGNYSGSRQDRSNPDGDMGFTALEPDLLPHFPDPTFSGFQQVAWTGDDGQELSLQPASFEGAAPVLTRLPNGMLSWQAPAPTLAPAPALASLEANEPQFMLAHYEDDPMEMHDHPTARDRLGDKTAGLGAAATLLPGDAAAIQAMPGIEHVVSGVHENARIFAGGEDGAQWFTRMHGTEWALPELKSGWVITHGRFLDKADADDKAQVMVLGRVAADKLFGEDSDPVGEEVTLWNQQFKVIGVVSSRSWATQPVPGDDQFDAVYVPVTTINGLLNLSKLNTISITVKSAGDVSRIADEIKLLLRGRHEIGEATPDDFTVTTMAKQAIGKGVPPQLSRIISGNLERVDRLTLEQLSASLRKTNVIMLALLASVATVSLLVGGIGVMNLLLLSVTQRTREVGLRMALGARRSDIAVQFVTEALLLCVTGGILGIAAGVFASGALEQIFHWSAVVSPLSALLALIVAALLGIAFSIYPARRASLLDPIEALRHE